MHSCIHIGQSPPEMCTLECPADCVLLELPGLRTNGCVCNAGEDLHKVLWLKSRSSEVWLERRTHYTRSTGVMSMVLAF